MIAEAKVGEIDVADGTPNALRSTTTGALVVQSAGRSWEQDALDGKLFYAAMQTPATTSTTLNTTFVGLGLCNPTGSGKVLIVEKFFYAATAALTAETLLALAVTTDSGFAADITPGCTRHGAATSVALVDKGATIVAPTIRMIIATLGQAADSAMGSAVPPNIVNLDGSIILDPGRALVTDTTVATGAVMQFGFMWKEIDV